MLMLFLLMALLTVAGVVVVVVVVVVSNKISHTIMQKKLQTQSSKFSHIEEE